MRQMLRTEINKIRKHTQKKKKSGYSLADLTEVASFPMSCGLAPRVIPPISDPSTQSGNKNPHVDILQTAILTVCERERTTRALSFACP